MDVRAALRSTLFALGLTAVAAPTQSKAALSVTPNPVAAGKGFVLYLQGLTADCFTVFARESVTVMGTRIDLRYTSQIVASASPEACPIPAAADFKVGPAPALPNLPMFFMPALAAGKYEVWASDVPECVYSGCKIAVTSVSAGFLEVQKPAEPAYTFTPTSAIAGQAFDLHLLSYGFSCATTYENLVVQINGNVILLSFFDKEPTGVACPAVYMPYGPIFRIPALPAGNYEVRVDRNMMSAPTAAAAGNLQITAAVRRQGWYLKQRTAPPDAPFQMQLLQDSLATCTSFSNLNAVVSTSGIYASFVVQTGRCAQLSPEPIGPVFAMPALKAGTYPVYVTELMACEFEVPMCAVDRLPTKVSDTLVVAKSLAVRMSALRAGAPKVELLGNQAWFALPEGKAGQWRAELMTLDGRVLEGKSLAGAPGDRVSMPVGRAPAGAVSLLRLTSPAGAQRLLPIVR
jgi:hypothetical protein